jgi:deoxyribodipyrimidine photo-lyase
VAEVAGEVGAATVFVTRDYGPYGRRRDADVVSRLAAGEAKLTGVGTPYAVSPGDVTKADGTPYAVFTPFSRAWGTHARQSPLPVATVAWRAAQGGGVSDLDPVGSPGCALPAVGEDAAWARWQEFATERLRNYARDRNDPGRDGSSHLSADLRWGVLHPRQILAELDRGAVHGKGADTFAKELCWREFYADVLFHRPRSASENLDTRMDALPVDTDAAARRRFDAWAAGCTGFPIVDAGMRQLLGTGWMHNRVRMIVASFLVKDLHLPWQWGARHFMQHLIDGDLASNSHGWQWTAGTGTDAAPYFRIFNPTSQSVKFDPDGAYIRRWVPELASMSDDRIHRPGDDRPEGYPPSMVDHAVERTEALARFQLTRDRSTSPGSR